MFCDPPYDRGLSRKSLITINQYDIVSRNNTIIIRYSTRECLPDSLDAISCYDRRQYGDTILSFYSKAEGSGSGAVLKAGGYE
ncbi:MAG: RsmD family RNA methyltransferase [Candidatus Omnitrophota bacterium]